MSSRIQKKYKSYHHKAVRSKIIVASLMVILVVSASFFVYQSLYSNQKKSLPELTATGNAYWNQKELKKLELVSDSIIDLFPESYAGYYFKGLTYQSNNFKFADSLFEIATKQDDIDANALYQCGRFYLHHVQYLKALDLLQQSVRLSPNDSAHFYLGDLYTHHAPNYQEALINLQSCLILDSNYYSSYQLNFNMGYSNLQLNKLSEALNWLEKARDISEANGEPLYYIGKVHFLTNNTDDACISWKRSYKYGFSLSKTALEEICQ